MSDKDDGGAAFPKWVDGNRPISAKTQDAGMSLRDYFAAAALQGSLACQSSEMGYYARGEEWQAAQSAYAFADAMLRERSK